MNTYGYWMQKGSTFLAPLLLRQKKVAKTPSNERKMRKHRLNYYQIIYKHNHQQKHRNKIVNMSMKCGPTYKTSRSQVFSNFNPIPYHQL